jgi:hypothetical protein
LDQQNIRKIYLLSVQDARGQIPHFRDWHRRRSDRKSFTVLELSAFAPAQGSGPLGLTHRPKLDADKTKDQRLIQAVRDALALGMMPARHSPTFQTSTQLEERSHVVAQQTEANVSRMAQSTAPSTIPGAAAA